jgi:hypothetical protein
MEESHFKMFGRDIGKKGIYTKYLPLGVNGFDLLKF